MSLTAAGRETEISARRTEFSALRSKSDVVLSPDREEENRQ